MKHYILFFLISIFAISCKKKENKDNSMLETDSPQEATYQSNLQTNLILTNNLGVFDTTFTFRGLYQKKIGASETYSMFPSTNYNGYIGNNGPIVNSFNDTPIKSSNYMRLANHSVWNITSSEFGNFQYTDSVPMSSISTSLTAIPTTFDANQGIPIKIADLQGSSGIALFDESGVYFNRAISIYRSVTGTIRDTIRDPELTLIPLNTTFTLSITSTIRIDKRINMHPSFIIKRTTYNYPIKRIN